jgi:hypothetical protein
MLAVLLITATAAFASNSATATNTVSPTLNISVTVNKAVRLTLTKATTCTIGVNAPGTPDYTLQLGNVDALAIEAPTCGFVIAPTNPGVTAASQAASLNAGDDAVYYSDYNVTPTFTGHKNTGANTTVTAFVSTDFAPGTTGTNNIFVVDAGATASAPTLASFGVTGTTAATSSTVIPAGGAVSGQPQVRFIGVAVRADNGTGANILQGSQVATVTFTLTEN